MLRALHWTLLTAACSSAGPVAGPDASSDVASSDVALADAASSDVALEASSQPKPLGFVPWVLMNAEKGTLGQMYQGTGNDQWTDADGKTTVDDAFVFEGKQSFKVHADQGTPNNAGLFGSWGGIKAPPTNLVRGDTLHMQLAIYIPTTFDWTANPWLKFLRFHTATSPGDTNEGYNDIYIYNEKVTPGQDGQLNNIYEGQQVWKSSTAVLSKGKWEVIEYEVTFDNTSVDNGGKARTRIWQAQNGVMTLALDRTDSKTLVAATDVVDGVYLFTYWNSGSEDGKYPSQSQDVWVDRIVLEKDLTKLVEKDAAGNPIIGAL
jgi:hypothetical protein